MGRSFDLGFVRERKHDVFCRLCPGRVGYDRSGEITVSAALPEPASGTALLAGGLAVIGIFRPRRRAA